MNPHSKLQFDAGCCAPYFFLEQARHDASRAKVEKVYLYPKPVNFRKSIDDLAALVELDIKVAVFDSVLFVFLNSKRPPNTPCVVKRASTYAAATRQLHSPAASADVPGRLQILVLIMPIESRRLDQTRRSGGAFLGRAARIGRHRR